MLANGIGCMGHTWLSSPACQELETIVLDWFGKAIGLPEDFLACAEGGKGGGILQSSASECILVNMLTARNEALKRLKEASPDAEDGVLLTRLVAYCSEEAHSCVEKAANICLVKLRILDPDEKSSLKGEILSKAMRKDKEDGLVPFFASTVFGSTSSCAFDNLPEIGPVCKYFGAWLHVDGAYAGNAMICPELRYLLKGIEYASSFNTNPNNWFLTNFDCSTMWVKDRCKLVEAITVDPLYLKQSRANQLIDCRNWGIPASRRFRALKLWFVIRNYGLEGIRGYIRNHCELAKKFEKLVEKDENFEVCNDVKLGLVCFRLKGSNKKNVDLLQSINGSGKLHMKPSMVRGKYVLRFCVIAEKATEEDIVHAWDVVTTIAEKIRKPRYIEMGEEIIGVEPIPTTVELRGGEGKRAMFKRLSRRFSFTKSVSVDTFQKFTSRSSLHDGVSPIVILDEEGEEEDTLHDVFFNPRGAMREHSK